MADAGQPVAWSAGEQRFDYWRRSIGLFAGPAALVIVLLWPMPTLSTEAQQLAAITTLVVVWWVTEAIPIPITAILGAALAVVFGVATASAAFAPFADPIIFLFIGSFILSRGVVEHGLDRRLARTLVSLPAAGRSFQRTVIALGCLAVVLSGWMSNMVVTAMLLPVALGLLEARGPNAPTSPRASTGLLLVIAYSAAIGGMTVPVGAAPNLLTIGLLDTTAGIRIGFLTWMALGIPIAVTMATLLYIAAGWRFPFRHERPIELGSLEPVKSGWTIGQRNAAIAFGVTVILWVAPGALALVAPEAAVTAFLAARLDAPVAAVIGATLLFLLPLDWRRRQFTIGWKQAGRIDWGTILLLGGGFSLGRMMFETGLAEHIATGLVAASGADSLWTITAMATAIAVLLTELTSNTAAVSMLVPVVISIAHAAGVSPVPPAVGTCFGAALAFMLPISTPSNAIVYGTGRIPIRAMLSFGIIMDVIGFAVIQVGLWILCPLLGLV